jgi:hypothetical protein
MSDSLRQINERRLKAARDYQQHGIDVAYRSYRKYGEWDKAQELDATVQRMVDMSREYYVMCELPYS